MEARVKTLEEDIKELTKIVYKLSEAQKISSMQQSTTTENINQMTNDIRSMLKVASSCDVVYNRLDHLESGLLSITRSRNWVATVVITAVAVALLSLVVKGAT